MSHHIVFGLLGGLISERGRDHDTIRNGRRFNGLLVLNQVLRGGGSQPHSMPLSKAELVFDIPIVKQVKSRSTWRSIKDGTMWVVEMKLETTQSVLIIRISLAHETLFCDSLDINDDGRSTSGGFLMVGDVLPLWYL